MEGALHVNEISKFSPLQLNSWKNEFFMRNIQSVLDYEARLLTAQVPRSSRSSESEIL